MRYNKPTIEVIGEAVRTIQGMKLGASFDGPPPYGTGITVCPAYELDD